MTSDNKILAREKKREKEGQSMREILSERVFQRWSLCKRERWERERDSLWETESMRERVCKREREKGRGLISIGESKTTIMQFSEKELAWDKLWKIRGVGSSGKKSRRGGVLGKLFWGVYLGLPENLWRFHDQICQTLPPTPLCVHLWVGA
jgi:hypothetical protein